MEFHLILLFAIALSLTIGVVGTYLFMRKMIPAEAVAEIHSLNEDVERLGKSNLKMMKDITKFTKKYRRLYGMLKKLRFDYVDELINGSYIKAANDEMNKEYFSENRTN